MMQPLRTVKARLAVARREPAVACDPGLPLFSEVERCDCEIAEVEAALLAGHPDVEGLVLALRDWNEEKRLIEEEL